MIGKSNHYSSGADKMVVFTRDIEPGQIKTWWINLHSMSWLVLSLVNTLWLSKLCDLILFGLKYDMNTEKGINVISWLQQGTTAIN